ncbi:SCO6880 family protein [Nocardia brasiliensis]|uniref:SCO6880 family protein n=1 Tax=Nocardia brasiliensis TaxID=37326 RepID=UPI002456A264|nr:SCO6880 family protein [Nocardia brasiliensis]
MAELARDARRTYGAGHEVRRTYAFGLPKRVFYGLAGVVLVGVVLTMAGLTILGLSVAALALLAAVPMSVRIAGKTGYELGLLERAWQRERRSGRNVLRAGPLSQAPQGRARLPGVAASTEMWWGIDKLGNRFGMIRMVSTGQYTVVLRCSPQGIAGMEQAVINAMVAEWGEFLALVGQTGDVSGIAAIAETIPETGARLRTEMDRIAHPDAPDAAREWLRQAGSGRTADRSGAQLHMRIAVTWKARTTAKRRDPMVMIADLAERLPQLCVALSRCQVVAEPMSDHQIAATVRRSYDPRPETEAAAEELTRHRGAVPPGESVDWLDAGPLAGEPIGRGYYAHDGAYSRTWVMSRPPSGFHDETILRGVLVGRSDVPRKRVALIYRPLPPAEAAESVHEDMLSATARVTSTRGISSARANLTLASTRQSRDEEARGAGVVDYAMLITATAGSLEELRSYGEIIKDRSAGARMQIRPAWAQQPAAFLAGLGVGVLLPDHATVNRTLQGEQ